MEGVTFSTLGGDGGAGIFSVLEWIMKDAITAFSISRNNSATFRREYGVPVHRLKSPQAGDAQALQSRVHRVVCV